MWLKANNPLYHHHIEIDTDEIDTLPEDGEVLSRVTCHEEEQEAAATTDGEVANAEVSSDENGQVESVEYAEDEDVHL